MSRQNQEKERPHIMTKDTLLRLSGVAAILGGGLRVVDAFLDKADIQLRQVAYFLTDTMLIFGLCGIYFSRSNRLGLVGLLGFATSITGIVMVRSFGPRGYLIGASVTLLGVVLIGVTMLARTAYSKSAPILWIVSLIVGLISLVPFGANWGVTLAGVTFGLGFVTAGIELRTAPASHN
jgi:hypothetical protein